MRLLTAAALAVASLAAAGAAAAQSAEQRAAAGALDLLHVAAARADADTYGLQLHPDLAWIGNEVSERWDRAGFVAFAEVHFADGTGWTYRPRQRHLTLAPDPCDCLAWFDEVLDSETYGTAVGTGLVALSPAGWQVLRYALTYPIPNDLAREMTAEIRALEAATPIPVAPGEGVAGPEAEAAAAVLDALHVAAAGADGAAYFELFAPDAIYIGTDVTERWTLAEFRAYAEPYFAQGRGWTYAARDRNVMIADTPCGCVAWFDEVLDSQSYGTSRGTGVLVRDEAGRWRIALYALTFPVPNALAGDFAARIRAHAADEAAGG